MRVGLGTGSTAAFLVRRLGEMVRDEGLKIRGVPTSTRTADLARAEGIEVITLEQAGWLDLTIDGADEFDNDLNLIKGGGGALLQEKIVAMGRIWTRSLWQSRSGVHPGRKMQGVARRIGSTTRKRAGGSNNRCWTLR